MKALYCQFLIAAVLDADIAGKLPRVHGMSCMRSRMQPRAQRIANAKTQVSENCARFGMTRSLRERRLGTSWLSHFVLASVSQVRETPQAYEGFCCGSCFFPFLSSSA